MAYMEIERKLWGEGWLGLIWYLGLEEKFIFILFCFQCWLNWFGSVLFNQFQTFETSNINLSVYMINGWS